MEQEEKLEGAPLTFDEILADKVYQSEFDKRVTKALDTAKEKWMEDSKKTEEERLLEQKAEMTKEVEALKLEKENAIREKTILSKGVSSDDVDYIMYKVSSGEGDFDNNLEDFLKSNQKFIQPKQEMPTTGFSQSGTPAKVSEEKAYLDKKYANNPFYKK